MLASQIHHLLAVPRLQLITTSLDQVNNGPPAPAQPDQDTAMTNVAKTLEDMSDSELSEERVEVFDDDGPSRSKGKRPQQSVRHIAFCHFTSSLSTEQGSHYFIGHTCRATHSGATQEEFASDQRNGSSISCQ